MLSRLSQLAIGVLGACWLLPALSIAAPNPGDRARDFAGYDIVGQKAVRLSDYAGRWVFLDFWASWCGPCVEELPNMLAQTAPYVKSGLLDVITISKDDPSTLADLKRFVRQYRMAYPVVYDETCGALDSTMDSSIIKEWDIRAIPTSYLINPQGVIVASELRGDKLEPGLDFFLNGQQPVIGLRGHHLVNADGSVSIFAEVMNPAREEMDVELSMTTVRLIWDEQRQDYQRAMSFSSEPIATVSFDEFGEAIYEFKLIPDNDVYFILYYLKAIIPGSEHIQGRDYADGPDYPGLALYCQSVRVNLLDVERVDGKYVIKH